MASSIRAFNSGGVFSLSVGSADLREMAELQKQVKEAAEEFRQSMRAWLETWQVLPTPQAA